MIVNLVIVKFTITANPYRYVLTKAICEDFNFLITLCVFELKRYKSMFYNF